MSSDLETVDDEHRPPRAELSVRAFFEARFYPDRNTAKHAERRLVPEPDEAGDSDGAAPATQPIPRAYNDA